MGNFNKRYIITEAESILEECNKKNNINTIQKQTNNIKLKIINKRLKRKNIFLKICNLILLSLLIISLI